MKFFIAILSISAVIAVVNGAVLLDGLDNQDLLAGNSDPETIDILPVMNRDRRFSCDLFSFQSQWVTPGHAVCAARCIAELHKGGSCQNNICVCREKWWQ